MIGVLTVITLIYLLVLVVVLAVSLIVILRHLWSIGTTLEKIGAGLLQVRDDTAPLAGHITAINGALTETASRLAGARDDLAATNDALGGLIGEPQEQAA